MSSTNHHRDSTFNPVNSPEVLRDRLERLFSDKHERERGNGARNFAWKP